ncbi:MAG TPA: hypothetical protein VKR81_07980, partial [Candidatus Binatia bacterium]|nr:hypothetical protein [Candidatus Binatia bacterium]
IVLETRNSHARNARIAALGAKRKMANGMKQNDRVSRSLFGAAALCTGLSAQIVAQMCGPWGSMALGSRRRVRENPSILSARYHRPAIKHRRIIQPT